jgi:hypothetical protein
MTETAAPTGSLAPAGTPAPAGTVLHLAAEEVVLVRSALRMLRNVLGRDEADELKAVQAILERLDAIAPPA